MNFPILIDNLKLAEFEAGLTVVSDLQRCGSSKIFLSSGMLSIFLEPFPTIETSRLRLRKITPDDVVPFLAIRSNARAMEFINRPLLHSQEEAGRLLREMIDIIDNHDGLTWAVCKSSDNLLIGTAHLWKFDKENHRAEIGYILDSPYQGKGLMSEALKPVIEYAFYHLKLHSIEAQVNPANLASIRLLEKNGFVKEAHYRENYYFEGAWLDTAVYSLLNPE